MDPCLNADSKGHTNPIYNTVYSLTFVGLNFHGFRGSAAICEKFILQQVFRVKKLVGLPPQLELLALALNCWLG